MPAEVYQTPSNRRGSMTTIDFFILVSSKELLALRSHQ